MSLRSSDSASSVMSTSSKQLYPPFEPRKSSSKQLHAFECPSAKHYCEFGAHNIVGKSNEDRFYLPSGDTNPEFTWFTNENVFACGVFDGHGGTFGADLAARNLCPRVMKELNERIQQIYAIDPTIVVEDDIYDTILCEIIRKLSRSLSREIKLRSITGTTSVTLFARVLLDGSCRILCANTGDSRCIAYRRNAGGTYGPVPMSEDHDVELAREVIRIQTQQMLEWYPLPATVISNEKKGLVTRYYPANERLSRAQELVKSMKRNDKDAIKKILEAMNQEDISISRCPIGGINDNNGESIKDIETELDMLDATIHYANADNNTQSNVGGLDADSDTENEMEDSQFIKANMVHKNSFIGRRTTKDGGTSGPVALFSRHNVSITMTRSIGDRHAARSCICTPDITAMSLAPDEYARFILASDGFWDVVTNEKAISYCKGIVDCKEAAKVLATKGRQSREAARMRMDDITVVVVDVNPSFNPILSTPPAASSPVICRCTIS